MNMQNHTRPFPALLLCLGSAFFLLAGCAATDSGKQGQSTANPDESETAQKPAGNSAEDGPIVSQVKSIDGAELNPLKPGSARITYTQGSHKGKTVTMTTQAGEGDIWIQAVESIRTMKLRQVDGQCLMPSEEDVTENVSITYAPPFVLLPARVEAGHKHQGKTTMTVSNLKTGKERDRGPCSYTVELLGMQTIATPAGRFEAYLFRTVREIDLSLAKVKVTIHTAHVPERGIVMTRVEQNTRAIGFISMNKKEEWRLAK